MTNLIGRVQNILLTPKTEWPVIAAEAETIGSLFTRYILIVSALGPVAMFLKSTLIGISVPFVGRYRVDMATGLEMLVLSYLGGLVGVYVLSLVINALAPTFGAQKDSVQALKAAAYSSTAVWVAGLGNLIPFLGVLLLLASLVYCIYLLYLGLQHTMKCPADKAGGYTAVSIIVAIVVWIVFSYIVSSVTGLGTMGAMGAATSSVTPSGKFEKGTTGAAIEEWAKNVEAAGKNVENSAQQNGAPSASAIGALVGAVAAGGKGVDALPTDQMKTFLPETLGGLPRTSVAASRNAAMGFQVAEASADYADASGKSLRLEVNDAGGAKGVFALANWAGVEEEREWQGGYEKTYRADGRMIHERWDSSSGSGEYSLVVGDRFSVELSGSAASMDELKAAMTSGVNLAGLETIAHEAKPAG
ncbi:MAG TPA: Yip1 family protein [Steroidobacteraceae bacterium]